MLSATMWFFPWYTTWPLALAALLNWKSIGRLMVVFTTLAVALYWADIGYKRYLVVYVPVFMLIAWHWWGVLRRNVAHRMA